MSGAWWTKQEDLDEDQKKVLRLPIEGSFLVTGPPGCGKTNLIVLRAKYLIASSRPNLKVVVYTRALKEFVSAGGGGYGLPPNVVSTQYSWATDFLREQSVPFDDLPSNYNAKRKALAERVLEVIDERGLLGLYHTILLDEAQDFLPKEIEAFSKLGRKLYAVADSHQKIYATASPLPALEALADESHKLSYHYRIGTKICRVADALGALFGRSHGTLEETSLYDDEANPSEVEDISCDSLQQQLDQMAERLKLQLRTYPGELLGVLTYNTDMLDPIAETLNVAGLTNAYTLHGGGYTDPVLNEKPICVSTVHSAKGLEFRAVHLVDADALVGVPKMLNVIYTAVTRAKTVLSVYHCDGAPAQLIEALHAEEAPGEVDLATLF